MRRIEIARALLYTPRLLLLDEPTVGLDIKARADILDHVRGLSTVEGIGVLWATYLVDELARETTSSCCTRGVCSPTGPSASRRQAGGADRRDAFTRVTGAADQEEREFAG